MQTLEEEEATTKDTYKITNDRTTNDRSTDDRTTGGFTRYNIVSIATTLMILGIVLVEKLIKITNSALALIITLLTET